MTTYTYMCLKIQQTSNSRPFYIGAVKAKDLLKWCDVPRSREGFMAGYQRELDGRETKVTEFFLNDPVHNIIPNAVIVSVSQSNLLIDKPEQNISKLSISHAQRSPEDALTRLIEQFEQRLNDEELASIQIVSPHISDDDEELGDADAATPPESYLAELTKNLRMYRDTPKLLTNEQTQAIEKFICGTSKPGLILDGQHRVFGAKEVHEFDVEFPVVILPGLEFSEQVFHFYVLNNKAKPLTRTHLRRIISTTLSKKEIGQLYDRLKDAGVEAKSAEWTHRMNTDQSSPFRGLIDMGLAGGRGVIPENVAYQLVSKFMLLKNRFPLLVSDVSDWNVNDNEYRLSAFYSLWRAIKKQYPNAWNTASSPAADDSDELSSQVRRQIFFKVSLLKLQEFILQNLNNEMPKRNMKAEESPLADIEELASEVGYQLPFLKEEFFLKEWKAKGLDTTTGHELFLKSMETAVSKQSRNLGNMTLFKG